MGTAGADVTAGELTSHAVKKLQKSLILMMQCRPPSVALVVDSTSTPLSSEGQNTACAHH